MKRYRVLWASFLFFLAVAAVNVTGTDVKAAVTISNTDTSTTKKVHAELMKGKATTLKVKGSKSSSKTKVNAIVGRIKKVNGQSVIFHYKAEKKSGKYYLYTVSKENARLYMYSVKFVSKLYSTYKTNILKSKAGKDATKYPNSTTRRLRIIYDALVERVKVSYPCFDGWTVQMWGQDAATTKTDILIKDLYARQAYYDSLIIKNSETTKELAEGCTDLDGNPFYRETGKKYQLYSFSEFAARTQSQLSAIMKNVMMDEVSSQQQLVLKKKFCDLSDAMKVYVTADSKYFGGAFKRSGYNMVYAYGVYLGRGGSAGMKILYENKAKGVCQVFASYEILLFNQIGVTSYDCSSYQINHAWTVAKVKNSSGKTLWIPFDYGIGPNKSLAVNEKQKKYVNTEAKRYKLYLKGIKGAPAKKNFVTADFK